MLLARLMGCKGDFFSPHLLKKTLIVLLFLFMKVEIGIVSTTFGGDDDDDD